MRPTTDTFCGSPGSSHCHFMRPRTRPSHQAFGAGESADSNLSDTDCNERVTANVYSDAEDIAKGKANRYIKCIVPAAYIACADDHRPRLHE